MVDVPIVPEDGEAVQPLVDMPQVEPDVVPEVEVAGAGTVIKKILNKIDEARPIHGDELVEPVEKRGSFLTIREATEEEVNAFNSVIDVNTSGKPPVTQINYDRLLTPEDDKTVLDQIMQTYYDYIDQQKRGKVTFDEMVADAKEKGSLETLEMLMRRNVGEPLSAEKITAGRMVLASLNAETTRLNKLVLSGDATDAERRQFLQAMSLEARAASSLLGGQAEAARATAAGRIGVDASPRRVDAMNKMLAGADENSIEWLAQGYAALPTQAAKQKFARGILGKAVDVWQEVWINSLLSGISTHAVNVMSNTAFTAMQIPERFIAGAIGSARRGITGSTEGVRMGEARAMLHGMMAGFQDALLLSARAFKDDTPYSGGIRTKLEVRERRAISAQKFGMDPTSMAGRGVDLLGVAVRLPGRFLIAEDEFFKAISGRMQLHAIAYRRMNDAISGGMPVDQAQRRYRMDMFSPDEDVLAEVDDFAHIVTFQRDLEGAMGDLQNMMSHPLAKIFVPFFRTPTNIMREVAARTPILGQMSPNFWKAMKAGGAEADAALAKLSLGASVMGTFSYLASGQDDNVIIAGSGPTAPGAKQAWRRQGFQPYSINIKQDDGSYKSVTFSRFDPISGMLAIAADFAEYAKYSDDPAELEQMAMAAGLAASSYMGELPMLQGMASVAEIFGQQYESTADRIAGAVNLLTKQAASTVLGPLAGGSMVASIERYLDPTVNETRSSSDLPPGIRGFYDALLQAKSRNPFFNDDLEPRLNLWAEEIKAGYGEPWEMMSPIRIRDAEFDILDQEIEYLNYAMGRSLMMPRASIDGVGLTPEQRNYYLAALNTELIDGKTMREMMLDEVLESDWDTRYADEKIGDLNDIMSDYKTLARNATIRNYADLEANVEINNMPYEEKKMMREDESVMDRVKELVE